MQVCRRFTTSIAAGALLAGTLLVPAAGPAVAQEDDPPACAGQPATIVGTDGDDHLTGTDGDDVIVAGDGDDRIDAGAGDDLVCAGDGDDTVHAGPGADRVEGDLGDDRLNGDDGDDVLLGGDGDADTAVGDDGFDACIAERVNKCETDNPGPQPLDTLPYPDDPQPLSFSVGSGGVDGVDLQVETNGGLYPWDVHVEKVHTTHQMGQVLASQPVELALSPGAPDFASATLTLTYDPARVTVAPDKLQIWTYDEGTQFWLPAPGSQTVDTTANTVTTELDHFSAYAILDMDADQPDWRRVFGATPVQCVQQDVDLGVDVAFMIDTSGSMSSSDPSDLRVAGAKRFVEAMGSQDGAGVVSFSGSAVTRIGMTQLVDDAARAAVNAALDETALDSGQTNISAAMSRATTMLSASEPGRPRIGLLLTDGVGTYSRADAEAAADADITVYTIGLGSGADATTLQEIADVTGGRYIQLSSADQLVPLYDELGGTIFDDGTDSDGDGLTDCVEINGAFVPNVYTRPFFGPGSPGTTEVTSAYIITDPNDPDTDGDGYEDGVELREADLRDDPALAEHYAFLVDAGVTRYFVEDSDPLDPFDPDGVIDFDGDGRRFRTGLLSVDGLDLHDFTLFQPDQWQRRAAIDRRLLAARGDGVVDVSLLTYNDQPVVYDGSDLCVENCEAVEALAAERDADRGLFDWGCTLFGNDFDCEVRSVVSEARGDQAVFASDDYIDEYFMREQAALRCAIETRNLDRCVDAAWWIAFAGIEPSETELIASSLTENDARWLLSPTIPHEIAVSISAVPVPVIQQGQMAEFLDYREALVALYLAFDRLDAATGPADGRITEEQLYGARGLAGNSAELEDAIDWLEANPGRLEFGHIHHGYSDLIQKDAVRDEIVRSEAFDLTSEAPLAVLRGFPIVDQGERGVDTDSLRHHEISIQYLVTRAVEEASPGDRTLHNEIVSRMPETKDAVRNQLITAMYIEYGQAVRDWVGDAKGGNWGLVAPWASMAIEDPIRGNGVSAFSEAVQQAAADGNQWIFSDVGSRYASFIEVIEADPNPTEQQWEDFFHTTFGPGDQAIRDGFLALVAARHETDLDRAQQLLFQSNALLATHEQAGVHDHLQTFDLLPGDVEGIFVDVEIGQGREFDVDTDLYDELGVDPYGPGDPDNLVWGKNLLSLDPTGEDSSTIYDAPGFDVEVGSGSTSGTIDVPTLSGVGADTPPSWSHWRADNDGTSAYGDTASDSWPDWEERMWYLLNLFRALHTDDLIQVPPAGRGVDGLTGYTPVTRSRLEVN